MSKCPAYCPPTCHFEINYCDYPVYCDDYDCSNPETCRALISSDCVVYYGTLLQQYGVQNGDTVTDIILQLAELLYPDCFTTTTTTTESPTTTTTTTIPCLCYTVTATEFCSAVWINCDGTSGSHNDFGKEPTITICAQENSLEITGLAPLCTSDTVTNGPCSELVDCETTTTSTTSTTTTSTTTTSTTTSTTSTTTTTTTAAPTTTTTTTVYPGPSGIFKYQNLTSGGSTGFLTLGFSVPGFPSGYALSSGSLPVGPGQEVVGTHAQVGIGSNITIWTDEAGSLKFYQNNVLIDCINVPAGPGTSTNNIVWPTLVLQTDDLVIVYSNTSC